MLTRRWNPRFSWGPKRTAHPVVNAASTTALIQAGGAGVIQKGNVGSTIRKSIVLAP
jgi:hypothetical protein